MSTPLLLARPTHLQGHLLLLLGLVPQERYHLLAILKVQAEFPRRFEAEHPVGHLPHQGSLQPDHRSS